MTGLPTVPVHDLQIHPRDRELIAGTHGRSIWIVDIAPLQQLTPATMAAKAMLFEPRTAFQWGESTINGGNPGQGLFQAPSPQYGASLWYRLTEAAGGQARIIVQNAAGDTLRTLTGPGQPGLHNVVWDFRGQGRPAPRIALSPAQVRDSIKTAQRMTRVLDSLEKAGAVPAPMMAMIRTSMQTGEPPAAMQAMFGGGGGGGGGRGGAGGGGFQERPGETRPMPSFAAAGGRGAGGGRGGPPGGEGADPAAGGAAGMMQALGPLRDALGDDMAALGLGFGGGGGRGGRGGGGNVLMNTGDYRITLVAGGTSMSRVLRIERVSGGDGGGGFGFGLDDDDRPLPGARR